MMKKTLKRKRFYFTGILLVCFLAGNAQMSMKKTDDGILVTDNRKAVFEYHTVAKSQNGEYERRNYIHPLYSVKGKILTEDFPSDHPHQRGIFWAWKQVWIGDKSIGDPWELNHFHQSLEEVEFLRQSNGNALLRTEVNWMSDLWQPNGRVTPYLKEKASITVWPVMGRYRRIDFEIRLVALEEGLKLGGSDDERGYGGFAVRMLLPDDVTFDGPDGKVQPENTAVTSEGFIKVSGSMGALGKKAGIVIVDHPDNPGYPQSWILRAKNSMQNAAWPGNNLVSISTKEPLVLRYTLLVYSGKMSSHKIKNIMGL